MAIGLTFLCLRDHWLLQRLTSVDLKADGFHGLQVESRYTLASGFLHKLRASVASLSVGGRRSLFVKMACDEVDRQAPAAVQKPKLHGRAFYESIGSPKYIVAPMVNQSEFVSNAG
jgi:hypothetical protein